MKASKTAWVAMSLALSCAFGCQEGPHQDVPPPGPSEGPPEQTVHSAPAHAELKLPSLPWTLTDASAVAVSPDGKRVAVGERRALHLVDAVTLEPLRSYRLGHDEGRAALNSERTIEQMTWSPDGPPSRVTATTAPERPAQQWSALAAAQGRA